MLEVRHDYVQTFLLGEDETTRLVVEKARERG